MTTGLTSFSTDDDPPLGAHVSGNEAVEPAMDAAAASGASGESNLYLESDSWRGEVAARLERYRTRRKPRGPRYPSLLLPFDAPERRFQPAPPAAGGAETGGKSRIEAEQRTDSSKSSTESWQGSPSLREQSLEHVPIQYSEQVAEPSAKIIEFPRSAAIPVVHASELADPIVDVPRIVEAPEVLPPPPALGGMLMEPTRKEGAERRGDLDLPSIPASIIRRSMAAMVDGAILGSAVAAFAAVFWRLNFLGLNFFSLNYFGLSYVSGPPPLFIGAVSAVALLLWMVYEFLFVVYTGTTPGLRAAKLQLAGFDGVPPNRRLRRWRVLASFLSAFSAALGYVWCFLDENGLCWHDRITRTYLRPLLQSSRDKDNQ
jgi:RDD family